jgi:hypothetical protein
VEHLKATVDDLLARPPARLDQLATNAVVHATSDFAVRVVYPTPGAP